MYLQYPFELNAVSYTRNWKIGASIFNVPQFHRTDSLAGADGFEPPINGIKIRCLTNLATPPVLRQGIEPKSAAYESAALPLSYLNNIRKELTPLWRGDSLRYSREFLLSRRSAGERPDKRNWPPVFYELTGERSLFLLPPTGNSQEPSGPGFRLLCFGVLGFSSLFGYLRFTTIPNPSGKSGHEIRACHSLC